MGVHADCVSVRHEVIVVGGEVFVDGVQRFELKRDLIALMPELFRRPKASWPDADAHDPIDQSAQEDGEYDVQAFHTFNNYGWKRARL